jgi:excisionase family DNA binding protein
MKLELEIDDINAIATRVFELLKPHLNGNGSKTDDIVFDPDQLAAYLNIPKSKVYKDVQNNALPYFKIGKYLRFRKSAIDKHIEKKTIKPQAFIK